MLNKSNEQMKMYSSATRNSIFNAIQATWRTLPLKANSVDIRGGKNENVSLLIVRVEVLALEDNSL